MSQAQVNNLVFPFLRLPQKRHGRVKTWTRHVDLFQKDFIFVPLNEAYVESSNVNHNLLGLLALKCNKILQLKMKILGFLKQAYSVIVLICLSTQIRDTVHISLFFYVHSSKKNLK